MYILTNNFAFLKENEFKLSRKNEILSHVSNIESELKKPKKLYDSKILIEIRYAYERIMFEIADLYGINYTDSSEAYNKFIKSYSNDLTGKENLSFVISFKYGCLGAHCPKNNSENNKVQKFEILACLNSIRTLLKFLYRQMLPKTYIEDDLKEDPYNDSDESSTFKPIKQSKSFYKESIKANLVSISDFFNINFYPNTQFYIPNYQRGYSWSEDHVLTFLNDINKRALDQSHHYFGVIALKITQTFENNLLLNRIKIIDGQQRMTTSMLFLCSIRDELIEKYNLNSASENETLKPFFGSDDRLKKLFYNPSNFQEGNFCFEQILTRKKVLNQKEKFYQNYLIIRKWLHNFNKEKILTLLSTFLETFKVARIWFEADTFSTKKEMEIFENLNSKGKELTSFELIKNYLFSLCSDSTIQDYENELIIPFNDAFYELNSLDENTKNEKAKNFMVSLINYFSNDEIKNENREKRIFSLFSEVILENFIEQRNVDGLSFEEYKNLMRKIKRYFKIYYSLVTISPKNFTWINQVYGLIELLSTIQSSKISPIILVAYYFFDFLQMDESEITNKADFELKKYLLFFIELIKPMTLNGLMIKQGSNKTLRVYSSVINEFRKKINIDRKEFDLNQIANNLFLKINNLLNSNHETEFNSMLTKYEGATWSIKTTLQLIEWNLMNFPKFGQLIKRKKMELEHIMPQSYIKWKTDIKKWNNLQSDDDVFREHIKYVNKLGNYLLLSKPLNIYSSDDPFEIKQKEWKKVENGLLYKNGLINDVDIFNKNQWTFNDIDKRTNFIFEKIKKIFNFDR